MDIQPQLYALTPTGPQPLPAPPWAADFTDLYAGLSLGVYSVIRTFDHNRFLHLEHHLARTVRSMELLGWDYQLDEERLRQAIHDLATAYPAPEMRVRIDILAEPIRAHDTDSRELLALMPFTPPPAKLYADGVVLGYAAGLHRANPLAKTADFASARKQAAGEGARGADFYDYLMVNEQEEILEATSANFYAVRDGVLYTAGEGVLEGVTRRIVLELLAAVGMPLQLQAVHVVDVATLDEALISSSSRGILPVVQIGQQVVGTGTPGAVAQQLVAAYNTYVKTHIETAV